MQENSATVMIIAHRLATVIDADRILVMEAGTGIEYDHPFRLLVESDQDNCITRDDSHFAKMIQATGIEQSQQLFDIAKEKYQMT